MKTALQLILIGLVIMMFSRCSTAKELLEKAEKKDPAIVAAYARDKYPCTDLLRPDTVTLYEDSLVFIECPDSLYSSNDYANVITDTLWQPGQVRTVRVPVKILVPSQVITRWYEDSAKLKVLAVDIGKCTTERDALKASNDSLKAKANRRGIENWIWRVIAAVLLFFWIKGKLTTIKIQRI